MGTEGYYWELGRRITDRPVRAILVPEKENYDGRDFKWPEFDEVGHIRSSWLALKSAGYEADWTLHMIRERKRLMMRKHLNSSKKRDKIRRIGTFKTKRRK